MKKLERFIGGTTNRPMKTRRSGMLFIGHAFKSVRERHLHGTARLPIQPSSSTVIFLHTRKATTNHFGAPTSRAGMTTTIWRPRVRIDVPDVGDAENTDTSREELTTKGTKRKIAPRHYGPCEHGVKYRSRCKVCSACPHGRRRLSARSAVGQQSASTVVSALRCKECGGHQYASTVVALSVQGVRWGINLRARSSAPYMQGVRWGINLRARSSALSVQGVRWGINLRARSSALYMQGVRWVTICEHGRRRLHARSAVGQRICEHGRQRSQCKECGGSQICEHGRRRHRCKECQSARV